MNRILTLVGLASLVLGAMARSSAWGGTLVVDQKHPAADNGNPGTPDKPLRSIAAAVSNMVAGDTVIIKGGIYRECVQVKVSGTAGKPVTIEGAPGETVVVSGSDLVKGWTKVVDTGKRPIWARTPWKEWLPYGTTIEGRGMGPQLIVDNALMPQVAGTADLFPGSFCYDAAGGGTIYVWLLPPRNGEAQTADGAQWWDAPVNLASADPNDHQVEASVRAANIVVRNQSYVTLRNLVARYNTAGAQEGGIAVGADKGGTAGHNTVEGCVAEFGHGVGLHVSGDHATVRHCYTRYNGGMGAAGCLTDSVFEDNVLDGNSTRGHSHAWEAGGVKFVRSIRLTVRGCQFINNDGPGLWFDWGHSDLTIERNFASFNSGAGIMVEVSPGFDSTNVDARAVVDAITGPRIGLRVTDPAGSIMIRNNVCIGNRWDGTIGAGILLQMASQCIVANNTCVDNAMYGIFVRYHPYDPVGHRCMDNTILNNICADNGGSQIEITPDPRDKPGFVARNRSDYNLFWSHAAWLNRNESTQKKDYGWNRSAFARWGKTQGDGTYSVEEWFKMRGYDEHSLQGDPLFVSPATLDFRLRHDSPAIGAGEAVTHVTDDYLGRKRPAGRAPSIGALEFFPDKPEPKPRP